MLHAEPSLMHVLSTVFDVAAAQGWLPQQGLLVSGADWSLHVQDVSMVVACRIAVEPESAVKLILETSKMLLLLYVK